MFTLDQECYDIVTAKEKRKQRQYMQLICMFYFVHNKSKCGTVSNSMIIFKRDPIK